MRFRLIISSVLFVLLLTIYAFGVSPSVFGGDGGDVILSYFFGGVAHPPGYPLNTMIGWLLTRIPIGPSFAFRANLVSAIYCALAISLMFYLLFRFTKKPVMSLSASLTLAFVPLYWLYAHAAEEFQLSLVLIGLSLIFLFEGIGFDLRIKKNSNKLILLSLFFLGLACFHHQINVLLLPSYIYFFAKNKNKLKINLKQIILYFFVFLAGFLPYIFIPFAAMRNTPLNWDNPLNIINFLRLITRSDYGTFIPSVGILGFTPKARFAQIIWYSRILFTDFTIIGIVFGLIGAFYLYFKNRLFFWFFISAFLLTGPLFFTYASFPLTSNFNLGALERFFLNSYLFFTVFIGFGMFSILNVIANFINKNISGKPIRLFLFEFLFLMLPLWLFFVNFPKADLSKYWLGSIFGRDILASANPPGIIFLTGDNATFASQYSYYVDKVNNSSKIILTGRLSHAEYRDQVRSFYPELKLDASYFSLGKRVSPAIPFNSLVKNNIDAVPIYATFPEPIPSDYSWVSEGTLYRLYKKDQVPTDSEVISILKNKFENLSLRKIDVSKLGYRQFFEDDILSTYAGFLASNGLELYNRGLYGESQKYFNYTLGLDPNHFNAQLGLAGSYFYLNNCKMADSIFKDLVKQYYNEWRVWDGYSNVVDTCFGDKVKAKEYLKKSQNLRQKGFDTPVNKL